jgi:cyclophilin family peptidyl-prolyl cis-trans isomerase
VSAPAAGALTGYGPADAMGLRFPSVNRNDPEWRAKLTRPDPFPMKFDPKTDYYATIRTTKGELVVKFFPDVAPKHVTNFLYLSRLGFYDGTVFHRVCPGFMMQGGDPTGTGFGGSAYRIPAEFSKQKHVRGVLSMAHGSDPDSASSQFFLMFAAAPHLDGSQTAFGQVVEGLETLDRFDQTVAAQGTSGRCEPKSREVIQGIDVFIKDRR